MTDVMRRTGGFRSRRFVFTAPKAYREVQAIAAAAGWESKVRREDREVWVPRPGLDVSYVEVPDFDCCFVMATSSQTAEVVESAIAIFLAHPYVHRPDDLLAAAERARGTEGLGYALVRAGIGAPAEVDQRWVALFDEALRSEDGDLRVSALRGISFAEWPELRPLLSRTCQEDPDEDLRNIAAGLLRLFDEGGVPQP